MSKGVLELEEIALSAVAIRALGRSELKDGSWRALSPSRKRLKRLPNSPFGIWYLVLL